jgi:hypothetical protein
VVTGWAAAVVLIAALLDRGAFDDARGDVDRSTWASTPDLGGYALIAVSALVLGWVVAVAVVAGRRVGAVELTALNAAFLAACACIAALTALLLATLLIVLREALPAGEPARHGIRSGSG